MAKIKSKQLIGKKEVTQIEVEGAINSGDLSNSYHSFNANGLKSINKNCNGPHVPLVVVDEIDTVSGEGLRAFKEISGMLDSKGNKKALRVGISTRKSSYGLMNQQMETADKQGRTVRKWTSFEFTERCPDSKSGTTRKDLYILQDKMDVLSEEEWINKDEQKKKEYEKHTMYEGCHKCPLASICLGDAKNQKSTSPMLKTLGEMSQKVLAEGADWALAQLVNLKPSMEGIIYREYEEKVHLKSWNQMWKILTNQDFPGECTHDLFVKKCHELQLPAYGGLDFGWSSPSTIVIFFMDKRDNVYVVRADGATFTNDPKWIHYVKTKYHYMYRVQLYFPDIANGSAIDLMKQGGLPVANKIDKSINLGIQVIKRLMKTPGQIDPKIVFAKETTAPLIDEIKRYHYRTDAAGLISDEPEDEFNHYLDALRYPLTMLLGKMAMMVTSFSDTEMGKVVDGKGNFIKVPSPKEFAEANKIDFNDNPEDANKVGKVGKLSDIEDPDDDGSNGSDGSFIWGF